MDADDGRVRLHVALDIAGDPIRGTICDGIRPAVEFTGWLELMSMFEIARCTAKPHASSC